MASSSIAGDATRYRDSSLHGSTAGSSPMKDTKRSSRNSSSMREVPNYTSTFNNKSCIWFDIAFDMRIHQKPIIIFNIALRSCPSSKLVLGPIKNCRFVQSPNLHKPGIPDETKKTCTAIWSRVHRTSARDHFPGPVSWQKHFLLRTNSKASDHPSVA